ncbi:MAG: hypothetical protein IT190_10900, partial [Microbacteriaceae bacterium]|nr:hypothetical protein [Microbacteriaceae bacterium]
KTCNPAGDGFGPCEGQVLPASETCKGSLDDENCNGVVNEKGADPSCVCSPKETKACYGGPVNTRNVGACKDGVQTCVAEGTGFGPCEGDTQPSAETCAVGNDLDEDCDGQVNEGGPDSQGCSCKPGEFVSCYEGNPAELTTAAGICVAGARSCNADGASFGPCNGQILPKAETCDPAGVDEDCDGQVDEEGQGCECLPGQTQPCWEGPPNAVFGGTSLCVMGTQGCNSGKWGACLGQVLPSSEPTSICTANVDENCDGDPIGLAGVDQDGDGWSVCQGDCCDTIADCTEPKLVNPGAYDVAGNNLDDDCEGTPDNALTTCDAGLASNSGNALDYA